MNLPSRLRWAEYLHNLNFGKSDFFVGKDVYGRGLYYCLMPQVKSRGRGEDNEDDEEEEGEQEEGEDDGDSVNGDDDS